MKYSPISSKWTMLSVIITQYKKNISMCLFANHCRDQNVWDALASKLTTLWSNTSTTIALMSHLNMLQIFIKTLKWHHNECDSVSNPQRLECQLNRLFRRRYKKTSKLRVAGLCDGNSSVTGEFPAPRTSNEETVSIYDVIMNWYHPVARRFLILCHIVVVQLLYFYVYQELPNI